MNFLRRPIPQAAPCEQAKVLRRIEGKFTETLPCFNALTPWLTEMGALADRYTHVGRPLEDLQARFDNRPAPMGDRFFFLRKDLFDARNI